MENYYVNHRGQDNDPNHKGLFYHPTELPRNYPHIHQYIVTNARSGETSPGFVSTWRNTTQGLPEIVYHYSFHGPHRGGTVKRNGQPKNRNARNIQMLDYLEKHQKRFQKAFDGGTKAKKTFFAEGQLPNLNGKKAHFKKGGKIPKSGLYKLHKGEVVVPAHRVKTVDKALKKYRLKPLKKVCKDCVMTNKQLKKRKVSKK